MLKPDPREVDAFLLRLKDQASFLCDPALIAAMKFIERLAYGADAVMQNNNQPENIMSRAA